jgi:hypothetical protein
MLNGFYLFHRGKASDYMVRVLCVVLALLDTYISFLNKVHYRIRRCIVRTRRLRNL